MTGKDIKNINKIEDNTRYFFSISQLQENFDGLKKKVTLTEEKSNKLTKDIETINSNKNSLENKISQMNGKVDCWFVWKF